jgi:DMSO/TMAO reductase YedYZ molybdopterin-dependent catalytic subunit
MAFLDCTSGWAIETAWSGASLASVLDEAGIGADARKVRLRSATGWTANLSIAEARECLLATDVAGAPLPLENSAPVRLVAPNRRGLDWVKWVREVAVE